MQRTAVFVDAGYLFAQGSVLLTGSRQSREHLSLDIQNVVLALKNEIQTSCNQPLLRIYWYDAMRLGRPTPEQSNLADSNEIKVRLGQINSAGEQKGVDALIITDIAELARNHAITDAILVSGDEDVRVGVVLAQQFGVRVHLVGIHPARGNQARSLMQEADTTVEWDASKIGSFLTYTPPSSTASTSSTAISTGLLTVVQAMVSSISPTDIVTLKGSLSSNPNSIPNQYDKELLRIGRRHYSQTSLSDSERTTLRSTFVQVIQSQP